MGVGVVARNVNGACMAWVSRRVVRPGDGEMAEAVALREAVQLATRKGWRSVIFEGDCANLIKKLCAPGRDFSSIEPIIVDIHVLASQFLACCFSLVKRSGNVLPHSFA
ncbi:UNVERIFIED_CONTAM: hypothetical protein Sradi_4116100 [Sesamum radiatum]|uniref:RNase H type-1 domain-containing protein n=1 Tax=Sesamum radiatum TaxID=300843 RepID=A0AAW2P0Z0_SESRA